MTPSQKSAPTQHSSSLGSFYKRIDLKSLFINKFAIELIKFSIAGSALFTLKGSLRIRVSIVPNHFLKEALSGFFIAGVTRAVQRYIDRDPIPNLIQINGIPPSEAIKRIFRGAVIGVCITAAPRVLGYSIQSLYIGALIGPAIAAIQIYRKTY